MNQETMNDSIAFVPTTTYTIGPDDMEGLKKQIRDYMNMPYVSLRTEKRQLTKQRDDMKAIHSSLESAAELFDSMDTAVAMTPNEEYSDGEMAAEVAKVKQMNPKNDPEVQKFIDEAPGIDRNLAIYEDLCDFMYADFDNMNINSSFIADSMSAVMQRNLDDAIVENADPRRIKKLRQIVAMYDDRLGSMLRLLNKLSYGMNVYNIVKDFTALGPEDVVAFVDKYIGAAVNDKHLGKFRHIIACIRTTCVDVSNVTDAPVDLTHIDFDTDLYHESEVLALLIGYWMARVVETDRTGTDTIMCHLFMTNVYDSATSPMYFDIPNGRLLIYAVVCTIFHNIGLVVQAIEAKKPAKAFANGPYAVSFKKSIDSVIAVNANVTRSDDCIDTHLGACTEFSEDDYLERFMAYITELYAEESLEATIDATDLIAGTCDEDEMYEMLDNVNDIAEHSIADMDEE